jgi:hypothetical protein
LFNGVWIPCEKGKSPNSRKDDCEYCPDGSYSTNGICQPCAAAGSISAPLRDVCTMKAETPLYKEDWLWGVVGALVGVCGLIGFHGCWGRNKADKTPSSSPEVGAIGIQALSTDVTTKSKKIVL